MPKMTRRQVCLLVDDDANWKIIPGNDFVQIGVLDFGSLHFAVTFTNSLCNYYESYIHGSPRKYRWMRDHYFEYDPETHGLIDSVSNSMIKDRIYEEAKKA